MPLVQKDPKDHTHRDHSPTAGAQWPLGLRQLPFCTSSTTQQRFKNGKWGVTYPWEMMNTYLFKETCTQNRRAARMQYMQPTVSRSKSVQHNPIQHMHRTGRALCRHQEETWCFRHAATSPCVLCTPKPTALRRLGYWLVAAHNRQQVVNADWIPSCLRYMLVLSTAM